MCAEVQVSGIYETRHGLLFPCFVDFESGSVAMNVVHNRIAHCIARIENEAASFTLVSRVAFAP